MIDLEQNTTFSRPVDCLGPLTGAFVGFVLGSAVHLMHRGGDLPLLTSEATGLVMFVFAVFGWTLERILRRKQLHCGGTFDLKGDVPKRYFALILGNLGLICLTFFLCGRSVWANIAACAVIATTLLTLSGEIGWGNPLQLLDWQIGRYRR